MPEHNKKDEQQENSIPLSDTGEYVVPAGDELPEPPPDKKIHTRRRLPLVRPKKPAKKKHDGNPPGD